MSGRMADTREGSYSYSNNVVTDEATASATSLPNVNGEEKAGEARSSEGPLRSPRTEENGERDSCRDGAPPRGSFNELLSPFPQTSRQQRLKNAQSMKKVEQQVPEVRAAATSPAASDDRTTDKEMEQAPEHSTASTSPAASMTITSAPPEPVAKPRSKQQKRTQRSPCRRGGTDGTPTVLDINMRHRRVVHRLVWWLPPLKKR